jgi:outer membrane receptor protein involved in Fe transport
MRYSIGAQQTHRILISASPMALAIAWALSPQAASAQSAPQSQTAPQSAPERSSGLPPEAQAAEAEADRTMLQQTPAAGSEIVVTATRVIRDGYSAPTPVTVFGQEDILRAGEANVFQAAVQLPSLAGSNSTSTFGTTQSTGTGGLSTLNLRGLGTNRTLTLLDGQRVVGALNIGVTDAGAFPQALVKRVDIVTGGASASWGSDAVAGVVNYVLDHDFVGVKANVSGAVTTYGDDEQAIVSVTAGTRFLNDRAHFIVSGEIHRNDGVPRGIGGRDWYDGTRILQRTIAATPAGQPQYIVAPHVVDMRLAPGGIITAGPLRGIAFGPGGTPYNFQYGPLVASPNMAGGDQSGDVGNNSNLDAKLKRETLYLRLAYDLTPDINVYGTYNHGGVRTTAHSYPGQYRTGTLTIQCDNAFLPASIRTACATNAITSFQYGSFIADLPDTIAINKRNMDRFTAGLDGKVHLLDADWTLNAYYAHGRTFTESRIENNTLNNLVFAAIDAVAGPNGTIICRSAAARAQGCVPLNIIGTGVASQSAIDWVSGVPYLDTWLTQDVAAISTSSEPFRNWAGPVSIAFGGEYRREGFRQEADPQSKGNAGNPVLSANGNNWFTGNFRPAAGSFHVWEAFAETVIPLVDNKSLGKAELNLAVRATDYSQSGYVTTWKVGATWDTPIDGLRLRGLQSRDIRAPNLSELFRAPANLTGTVIDRFPPFAGLDQTINQATLSNLNLDPEKSRTKQVGVIYQPAWFPGFSASVDYYDIKVTDAIGTISAQQTVDLCFQGNSAICEFIIRNPAGQITEIQLVPVNLASVKTRGLDIETSYRRPLGDIIGGADGVITLRAFATHVIKFDTNSGLPNAVVVRTAGQNSGNIADWRVYASQAYSNDRLSFSITERYVSPGVINNAWIECTANCPVPTINNPTVNNNRIKGAIYVDIGGSFKITNPAHGFKSELYFKIDNLLNRDPPIAASAGINPYLVRSVNSALYDTLGRTFRIGARLSF